MSSMFLLVAFLCLFVNSVGADSKEEKLLYKLLKSNRCPIGYRPFSWPWMAPPPNRSFPHKCYKLVYLPDTWYNAFRQCYGDGGNLAVVSNPFELGHVTSRMNRYRKYVYTYWRYWIGGNDIHYEGKWVWESNNKVLNPWIKRRWGPGEPSPTGADCLSLGTNSKYYADYCHLKLPYVCERDLA